MPPEEAEIDVYFQRLLLLAFIFSTSLVLATTREDCGRQLTGRRIRTLYVQSNWNEVAILRTRNGQTVAAYEDNDYNVRVDDLQTGKVLWKGSTKSYVPKIALAEGKRGKIQVMLSRTVPQENSNTLSVIETEIVDISTGKKTLRVTSIGPLRGKITSHVHMDNGQEIFFVQGQRMAIVPLGGETLVLAENEFPNIPGITLSHRGTPLVSTFNKNVVELFELKDGKFQSLWTARGDSYGQIYSVPKVQTRVAYRARGRLVIQDPFDETHPPLILPSSRFEVAWHSTPDGEVFLATEGAQDNQRLVNIYNITKFGKVVARIPLGEGRPFLSSMSWSQSDQGPLFVYAETDTATIYHLINDEAKILRKFKVEIGAGNLKFYNTRDAQYLLTPARVDGKVIVYNVLKESGDKR